MRRRILKAAEFQPPDDPTLVLSQRRKGAVQRAVKAGLKVLATTMASAPVQDMVANHNTTAVKDTLASDTVQVELQQSFQPIADLFIEAGNGADDRSQGALKFDPLVAAAGIIPLRDQFVNDLTTEAQQVAFNEIIAAFQEGQSPEVAAQRLAQVIGLNQQQAAAVDNYRRLLEQGDPEALRRALRDRRFDATVQSWVDVEAEPEAEQIDQMVARYAERTLAFRAETIAETESSNAAAQGLRQAYVQAVESGRLFDTEVRRFWLVTLDERTCFTAGTMVATERGERPIESIATGEMVYTRRGLRRIKATMRRQTCKPLIVISTSAGRVISMTADHPVFSNGKWTRADDLVAGDNLQSVSDQCVNVAAVLKIVLSDSDGRPAALAQDAVAARIFAGVGMPKIAINFERNAPLGQREINRVASHAMLLNKTLAETGQAFSRESLRNRLGLRLSVASKAAELSLFGRRLTAKLNAAGSAFNNHRRTPADFRAILSRVSGLVCENSSAPFAFDMAGAGQSTFAGADLEAFGLRRENGKRSTANWTRFVDVGSSSASAFARTRSSAALLGTVDLLTPASGKNLRTAVAAYLGGHADQLSFLDELNLSRAVWVFDLEVDDAPEFFASGVLVHNCPICAFIPILNADGVGVFQPYLSPIGPIMAPTVHPRCRCSERYTADLSRVLETPFQTDEPIRQWATQAA